jgi:hypothetical protein
MIIEDLTAIQKKLTIIFIVGTAFSLIGRGLMALGTSEDMAAVIVFISLAGFSGFEFFTKENYSLGVCQGLCAFFCPTYLLYFIFKNEINLPELIYVFLLASVIAGMLYMVWSIFTKPSAVDNRH